ncbi:MAG: DUF883 domain-containing protein [Pseudomonadales bacterium]|nr:DUF883 domain-containing protein [Pseudomonadales bacterium]
MHIEKNVAESLANGHDEIAHHTRGSDHAGIGASREFHNIIADIEDLVAEATSLSGEDFTGVATQVSRLLSSAKESMEAFSNTVNKRAHKTVASVDHYVHEQPWTAIGVGVGLGAASGLLLGHLLARRS